MRTRLATLLPRIKAAVERRGFWDADQLRLLEQSLQVMAADYAPEPTDATFDGDPMSALAEVFGLDELDTDLLLVAAAPDLDATFSIVFGLLRGTPGPGRASVGLALELCGLGTLDPQGFERIGESSPLRRRALLEMGGGAWLSREISLPDRVLGHLLGADVIDPAVGALAAHPLALTLTGVSQLAQALEAGVPWVWIRSATGAAGLSLAAGALASIGVRSICVDLERAPARAPIDELVRSAVREAALLGTGLIVTGLDRLLTGRDDPDASTTTPAPGTALTALHEAPIPVIAVARAAWDARWPVPFPLCVDAPALSPEDRTAAWIAAGGNDAASEGLAGLRLSPEAIVQTAAYAHQLATVRGTPLDAELARVAARRVSGSSGAELAGSQGGAVWSGRELRTSFADLVLPLHIESTLKRLVSWARHRDEALTRGSLLDLGDKGAGLAALFTGGPGTGKTLAAHVVADELGVELVQVDLSAIVDKYIGETEKNLERVFARAESLNVVLFFDEADALFGRRTEVKDSHDRHANQEVAYLLQRMEHFDGLTIMATNLRGNLDAAFSRRLNFVVNFPDPDTATRQRLWTSHVARLGPLDASDPPDFDGLAEVELAGGDIRNIVLAAGYDAAAAGQLPGMAHLRAATLSEFHKLGRRPPAEFKADAKVNSRATTDRVCVA